jgi:hypothetical protein
MVRKTRKHLIFLQFFEILVHNSFETRVRTKRFLERNFILFYIQEPIDVFQNFFLVP